MRKNPEKKGDVVALSATYRYLYYRINSIRDDVIIPSREDQESEKNP